MNPLVAISILLCCFAESSFSQRLKITTIATPHTTAVPTNTYWDAETQRLYYVDLFDRQIISYDFGTQHLYTLSIDGIEKPAIFLPLANSTNKYLASSNDEAFIVEWDGQSQDVRIGSDVFSVPAGSNVDSVSVGPNGKVYVGDFGPRYCLESARFGFYGLGDNNELKAYGDGFVTSVGGVVIESDRIYYHMDTCAKKLSAFTWDPATGDLSDKRHVMDLDYPYTLPVGLTADTNGFLYAGLYNGSAIIKINPKTAEIVDEYKMPTPLILFPMWGGPNNDILFVTTGSMPMNFRTNRYSARRQDHTAGSILQIEGLGATGVPAYRPAL